MNRIQTKHLRRLISNRLIRFLLAATVLASLCPVSAQAFRKGDRVSVISKKNVRSVPSVYNNTPLGWQEVGATGTVNDGPVSRDNYTWYYVNFDSYRSGWIVSNGLSLILVNNATLMSESANPTSLASGATFTKTWTFKNTGNAPWSPGSTGCTLNRQGGASLIASSTVLQLPNTVPVDGQHTFSVQLTAPKTAGTFTDSWQMNGPNPSGGYGQSFGPVVTAQATVMSTYVDGAAFVSQTTIPTNTVMTPGQSFTMTWTLQNTGTSTWTPGTYGYTLNYQSGENLSAQTYTTQGKSVEPFGEATFSVPMTAPTTPGTYVSTWQMSNANYKRFGPMVSVQIVVAGPPAPTLNAPASGIPNQSTIPTFSWSGVPGATSYRILVATVASDLPASPTNSSGGASVVINDSTPETTYTPPKA
jgi:hypothetical protein